MLVSLTSLVFIPIQLVGFTCCYKAVVWLSKGIKYKAILLYALYDDDDMQAYVVAQERI